MDLAASKSNPLAGTGVDFTNGDGDEKGIFSGKMQLDDERSSIVDDMRNHRRLTGRQIQLLAIAGTIGAALFVGIGYSLRDGGPLSLLLGFAFWASVIWATAQCQVEMVTLLPVDGSFIRFAGRFVDEAWGMAAGYNYFISQAALVCFEINIFNTVIGYWAPNLHPAILISVLCAVYFALNIWSVSIFGEAEFWLAIGKVTLIFMMICYTFITMVGGNPQRDVYGFRFWKEPGAMREYLNEGSLGRFQGFLQCVIGAAFIIAGPEYISMVAGEAKNPRKLMPRAFTSITYRLVFFFVIGALCVGIVCPYDAKDLIGSLGPSAARSPYTISMRRLGITVLPDIVNAMIATSIVSAGNSYMFGTSRSLYSLALAGQAPKVLRRLNRNGVPYLCVIVTSGLSLLSYLSVSAGTAKVLTWWISLVTASQLLNWIIMSSTWIRFNAGLKAQGLDRKTFLPYTSRYQPFAAWYALIMSILVLGISGYTLFLPGNFAADQFIFAYGMIFVVIAIYIGWKIVKRTRFWRGHEIDFVTDLQDINDYTEDFEAREALIPKKRVDKIMSKVW
ncbi:general amino acid permease agp2 [Cystobasidiomycetes sp. EMM_F5]